MANKLQRTQSSVLFLQGNCLKIVSFYTQLQISGPSFLKRADITVWCLIIPFIGLVHCHFLQSLFLQILSHSADVKHQHDLLNYCNYLCLPPLFYRERVYQNNLSRDLSRSQGKMLANRSRRNEEESEQDN